MADQGEVNRELEGIRRQLGDLEKRVATLAPSARTTRLEQRIVAIEQRAQRVLTRAEEVTEELAARLEPLEPEEPTLVGTGRALEPPPTDPAPELASGAVGAVDAAPEPAELGPSGAD